MDALLPLMGFAFAASVTPGPNNVMVAANAANHGLRATLPHMLGIAAGFSFMIVMVGLGLAGVLLRLPMLALGLRWVATGWLFWLAWKIATAPPPHLREGGARPPIGFGSAVLFQWVNPKAWMIALSIASAWVQPGQPVLAQLGVIGGVFFLVGPPSNLPWALMGVGTARLLGTPGRLRAFNVAMALLLVASMLGALAE